MIILKLRGGLGNQLFQYCAGLFFAKTLKTEVFFDVSEYNLPRNDRYRPFLLHEYAFHLNLVRVADEIDSGKFDCEGFTVPSSRFKPMNSARLNASDAMLSVYNEKPGRMPSDFQYINGYFCEYKYVSYMGSLQLRRKLDFMNRHILREIKQTRSVSVHFRRSDYLKKEHDCYSGICTDEYYYSSIKYFLEKNTDSRFFVFSDDPRYAGEFFSRYYPRASYTIIRRNHRSSVSYIDLYLMSQCKDNIIANSTFSWWGAFFNANPTKTVIRPEKYRNDQDIDIFPPEWITINSGITK
jgi:hypothetical protein